MEPIAITAASAAIISFILAGISILLALIAKTYNPNQRKSDIIITISLLMMMIDVGLLFFIANKVR